MGALQAQTPLDAIMMEKKEICFGLIYDYGTFDQYWEGSYLRENPTIAEVTRHTIAPMFAVGVHEKLNFYIGVPYIKTESSEPNGGLLEGAKGFQDLSFALKYEIINKELGMGKLAVFASTSYSTPLTNYLADYRPYSIGNGCNELNIRGIVQYKLDNGLYARVAGGHFFRGDTRVERDYYYANGSYYTSWMDVPNAWEFNGAVGWWLLDSSLKLEAGYYAQHSTSGDDIRKYNAPQPTNKVDFDQVIFSAQYFIKPLKGFGVLAYYSEMVNGRNMGKFTNLGAGVTYQFKI